ncbi:MAG TPA: hypothetical protein VLZ84_07855 [Asticcacaulis sp.]|nr:hypothetical protein [Asticcacaulis sp.]
MVNSPGFNPARRNKNIGTDAQGFKKQKPFGISSSARDDRRFYEKLNNPVETFHELNQHKFAILIEPAFAGFKYHVSIPDVLEVLKLIPESDRTDIKVIVFRQPKRKERIFSSVWGRMSYWADFGKHGGTSIIIEALPVNYCYKLGKHIGPDFAKEIEALRSDGHVIETTPKHISVICPPEAIRHTQLFRTLPHEIGHNIDYLTKVDRPYDRGEGELDDLTRLYFARPQREREQFANRYALGIMAPFRANDIVPFPPLKNRDIALVKPAWFYFDTADI